MALLARLEAALLQINDTSYDVFDNICFNHTAPHVNATIVINGSNDTNASNATNATNGTSAPPGSDRLAPATVGSGSTESTGVGAMPRLALLLAVHPPLAPAFAHADGTNVTIITWNATQPNTTLNLSNHTNITDFCASLNNVSNINGTKVVTRPYTPYCDPCLAPRRVVPDPFNHTSVELLSNRTVR